MFKKILNYVREMNSKQLMVAGVFTLALAGAVGLGFATKQFAAGATIRDNDPVNSIDGCSNNGGIGAADATELVKDIRDAAAGKCKTPQGGNYTDLPDIYEHFGLPKNDQAYAKFEKEAKDGTLYRDGRVTLNSTGEVVMDNAFTTGRTSQGKPANIRIPFQIKGKTYYKSTPNVSFASHRQSLPVMIWFDDSGTAVSVIMNACGNPVDGDRKKSGATCKALNKIEVAGKKNTYKFNTTIDKFGLAKITKVEYYIDGQLWKTETDPNKVTDEYTFTKTADVSVKVYVSLPGGKSKVIESAECKKRIEVEVAKPFYSCENLVASARDASNRKFRFTVKAKYGNGATLKDADFLVDGVTKNTGVTQKDAQGNIYQDYDFNDNVKHTIVAKVNFNVAGKVENKLCQASVTPEKPPVCEHNPNLPPEHPDCKKPECVEKPGSGFPPGDPRCKEQPELPKTGPGSLVGLFAGMSIAGTAAHRIFLRFRGQE